MFKEILISKFQNRMEKVSIIISGFISFSSSKMWFNIRSWAHGALGTPDSLYNTKMKDV